MRKIRLSSHLERRAAGFLAALIILALVFVMTRGGNSAGNIVLMLLCSAVTLVLVLGYFLLLSVASMEVENGRLKITGLGSYYEDLGRVRAVMTSAITLGPVKTRAIVLLDEEHKSLSAINSFFLAREGVMAEPAARELAEVLGIEFVATLQPWQYDKAARKQRDEELRREKKENKKRRRKSGASEDKVQIQDDKQEINYDLMDDD